MAKTHSPDRTQRKSEDLNKPDDAGQEDVQILQPVPEGPGEGLGYAAPENPDAPELSDTPGITELKADATAEEIIERPNIGTQRLGGEP